MLLTYQFTFTFLQIKLRQFYDLLRYFQFVSYIFLEVNKISAVTDFPINP